MCVYTCLFEKNEKDFYISDQLMMCDNLSLYKTYIPSPTTQSPTINPQFYPIDNDEHRPYTSIKRKLSGIHLFKREKNVFTISFTDILSLQTA